VSPDTLIAVLVIGLPALLIWVWAVVDATRNPDLSALARAVWLVVVVLVPGVGALLYIAIPGRKRLIVR
jgi:hypothetical protein